MEPNEDAFGLNRTGSMKDSIHSQRSYVDSAVQRVQYQNNLEAYGGTAWTIDTIPEIVMQWLANEDLNANTISDLAEGKGVTIATEIHTVMGQRDGSSTST